MTYDIRGTEPLPEFKDEEQVIDYHTCAECGDLICEGVVVDDHAGDLTHFCKEHVTNYTWVYEWFKRHAPYMEDYQREKLIIQKF